MKQTVASSVIAAIEYNEGTNELIVYWVRGGQQSYYNVPKSVYDSFLNADSIGMFFNANIKGKYSLPVEEATTTNDYEF